MSEFKSKETISSDADSGSEDSEPVSKKSKVKSESTDIKPDIKPAIKTDIKLNEFLKIELKSGVPKNDDGSWELERSRRVTVTDFKGRKYCGIREYYKDKASGSMKPGKQGITLTRTEFEQLMSLAPEIIEAFN